jgi:hypothetical protein
MLRCIAPCYETGPADAERAGSDQVPLKERPRKRRATLADMADTNDATIVALSSHPRYEHANWDELDRLAHSLDVVAAYLDPDVDARP